MDFVHFNRTRLRPDCFFSPEEQVPENERVEFYKENTGFREFDYWADYWTTRHEEEERRMRIAPTVALGGPAARKLNEAEASEIKEEDFELDEDRSEAEGDEGSDVDGDEWHEAMEDGMTDCWVGPHWSDVRGIPHPPYCMPLVPRLWEF